jgi:hypothetical protein
VRSRRSIVGGSADPIAKAFDGPFFAAFQRPPFF